jgi:hypothetical protein
MSWTAYVDESIRTGDGVYVMAAAVLDVRDLEATRDRVCQLTQRGLPFHWRLESPARRRAGVELVADLPSLHIVTIGAPVDPHRQERARRQCLEALLFHLQDAGVSRVWLETRNSAADRRDIEAVRAARARKIVQYGLLVDHARPSEEPLLWLADLVAGAVSAAAGGEPVYKSVIASMLCEHRIRLD